MCRTAVLALVQLLEEKGVLALAQIRLVLWLLAGCALSDLGNLRGDGYQLIVNHRLFEPPSYLMLKYAGSVRAQILVRGRLA